MEQPAARMAWRLRRRNRYMWTISFLGMIEAWPRWEPNSIGEILPDQTMQMPRVRFTVRSMMVVVAIVAVAMWTTMWAQAELSMVSPGDASPLVLAIC
jgi:hypothetical protein